MPKIFNSLKSIHAIVKSQKVSKICVVTSNTLAKKLDWAIKEIGIDKSNIILLPDGEKAKDWKELEIVLEKFSSLHLDRNSIVIALGGGTTGDITGFAASIYLRGIRYIQIPTTLLAQVDSAHGGKTGINFLKYKNQIGSFYLPIATVIEPRFIKSLSKDQIIDGLGEIIKAGFIKDSAIISLLKKETLDSLAASPHLPKIIDKAIKVKRYHIQKDFNDMNVRQLLNVGHTIGHALELKYGISHGKAVIAGMIQEFEYAESAGLADPSVKRELISLLNHLGIDGSKDMKAEWKTVLHDKKITGDKIAFPVVEKMGKAKLVTLELGDLKNFLSK